MLLLQDKHILGSVFLRGKNQVGPEMLATEAYDAKLTTEVGIVHQVPDCPDGDFASRRVDIDPAPIDVVQCNDIIHMRVLGK